MATDKDIKKQFKKEASQNPEKYYPVAALKKLGYKRGQCTTCATYFWSQEDRAICGDTFCVGGFTFMQQTPAKKKLTYLEVWPEFVRIHKKLGYTPIDRYPVVARWRDDTDFVQAGIYNYQPYIVTGEVEPPANPLVEPQFCLRFNDIDNVGITGSHYTGFVMIGEHAFMPPEDFNPDKYVTDHLIWLTEGLGLDHKDIVLHEDAWAGGGNFGPSIEFFSGGLELSNQVYIQFEQTEDGFKELQLKVLDMGLGHERIPLFTHGSATSYETTFPTVMKQLRKVAHVEYNEELMKKFLRFAALLNADEVEDLNDAWQEVADKVGVSLEQLQQNVLPLRALYSIADHSRTLLVALADGGLPSNTGGGYNLRVLARRALSFIDQYSWQIDLGEVCEWHAQYLEPLFPELIEHIADVKKILAVEKNKYKASRQKAAEIVKKSLEKQVTVDLLLELYDSHGVAPELIREEAAKMNKKVDIPADFYNLVTQRHAATNKKRAKKKQELIASEELTNVAETKALYFDDYTLAESKGVVLFIKDNLVILDQTVFYATSGGQSHDVGEIEGHAVIDVVKQGPYLIHVLKDNPTFSVGSGVHCRIDVNRRKQLAQHHTSAHIVGAAARRVLGNHINQAGAKKTVEKGHLDITHFSSLSEKEEKKIEQEANKIVGEAIAMRSMFLPRTQAEQLYGMRIYQGGAVPGKELRLVEIPEVDIQACGGTHLNNTQEAQEIKLLSTKKISDSVVRITYAAGEAAQAVSVAESAVLNQAAVLLKVSTGQVPVVAEQLFKVWKKARKAAKKGKEVDTALDRSVDAEELSAEALLEKTANVLSTQPEHVPKTLKRFLDDLEKFS